MHIGMASNFPPECIVNTATGIAPTLMDEPQAALLRYSRHCEHFVPVALDIADIEHPRGHDGRESVLKPLHVALHVSYRVVHVWKRYPLPNPQTILLDFPYRQSVPFHEMHAGDDDRQLVAIVQCAQR